MPASTNTRQVLRRLLYDQIPTLGMASTADSLAAGSLVDTYAFQDSNLNSNHFRGCYIYRPDRSGDDVVKKAGALTVASGTLAHTGTNYSNTSDTNYEIVGLIHPDELNECIRRALRRTYFEELLVWSPLVTDGDMETSGVTNWTATGTSSRQKVATAANVFSGTQALEVTNGAANDYVETASIAVDGGESVWVSAICRLSSGTACQLILRDQTNSTSLATYTHDYANWTRLWINYTVPTSTRNIRVRLGGTGGVDVTIWDHLVVYRQSDRRVAAPSYLTDAFLFQKLREGVYSRTTNTTHADAAASLGFRDWSQPAHFVLEPYNPQANAFTIQLNRPLPMTELWIHSKRPYSDRESLAADSDTTTAPRHLVLAYAKNELAQLLTKRYPTDSKWKQLYQESLDEVEAEVTARPEVPMQALRYKTRSRI